MFYDTPTQKILGLKHLVSLSMKWYGLKLHYMLSVTCLTLATEVEVKSMSQEDSYFPNMVCKFCHTNCHFPVLLLSIANE